MVVPKEKADNDGGRHRDQPAHPGAFNVTNEAQEAKRVDQHFRIAISARYDGNLEHGRKQREAERAGCGMHHRRRQRGAKREGHRYEYRLGHESLSQQQLGQRR